MAGGGGAFSGYDPIRLRQEIREAELEQAKTEFVPKLQELLDGYLASVNSRDSEGVQSKLSAIKHHLGDELELSADILFGGSVAKHTYVDGLSDVDALFVMRGADATEQNPDKLLDRMARVLKERLSSIGAASVKRGSIAITLEYSDGTELQIIPAGKIGNKLCVPSWSAKGWSKIDPEGFKNKLTKVNQKCGNKLVPTIKLVKAINATLPAAQQLSGYHIEALAVAAFKDYKGPHVSYQMLPEFFRRAKDLVKSPLRDSSNQSLHVDEYLGAKDSPERRQSSHVLDRIARRMENATAARSMTLWRAFFDE